MDSKLLILFMFIVVAGMFVAYLVHQTYRERLLRSRLNSLMEKELEPWQVAISIIGKGIATAKEKGRIKKSLISAGYRQDYAVDLFLIVKTIVALFVFIFAWFFFDMSVNNLLSDLFGTLEYLLVVFIGIRLPDMFLSDRVKKRQSKIRNTVPKAIDLMTICVDSGMSLEDSFDRVATEIEHHSPEVASEFRITRSEMIVMDRTNSLKRMEKRSGVRELESLASSLLQSITYGTALTESLRLISKESRAKQVSDLEEKAGKISARIGIPLILLILLPLVGIIAAPAVITLMNIF